VRSSAPSGEGGQKPFVLYFRLGYSMSYALGKVQDTKGPCIPEV